MSALRSTRFATARFYAVLGEELLVENCAA
jgi:hypothetical protein